MTNNKFKPGDLIFLIDRIGFVRLAKYKSNYGSRSVEALDIDSNDCYWGYGFSATPENREALVTLYSEETVPKIPLRGSELTRKLLEKQKYVLCKVSRISDYEARSNDSPIVHVVTGLIMDYFDLTEGSVANFAVPIDVDGNEITEY